jgi:hypothetical protein
VWYCTGMCMLCGKWSGVVLDIERQNAMPTLGIPRNSHLRGGMRGVSYFSFLGGPPRSNLFLRNESAGGMSGSRKGLSEKKDGRPPFLEKYCIVCGRLPSTTVNTYRRTYPTFCSTCLGGCLESNVSLSCQSRYIS